MSAPPVRFAFGALVLATIVAFFVTQQLKSEFPLVLRFAAEPADISPNGDDYFDVARVGFDLSEPAEVSFSVVDSEGREVRRIVDERRLGGDTRHRFLWGGRDDDGNRVPDGEYTMRVVRRDEGRVIDSLRKITVDTVPPPLTLTSAEPGVIAPGEPGQRPRVRIRYRGPRNQFPEFRIFRTDGGPPRVVFRFRGDETRSAVWDGRLRGRTAEPGDYAFTVTVRDAAGNLAVAPTDIPTPRLARRGTGVSVRRMTLRGPLTVVTAGSVVRLEVGPFARSFDYALSRLGSPRVLRRGGRIGGTFRVRIPRRARTGVYLVRVRAGRRSARWPVAVAGLPQTRAAIARPRPLVVLPTLTWQGRNPIDDDHDGFADTLDRPGRIVLDRPLVHGRLPPAFTRETLPLLAFLERARLAYDLTTDLALADRRGPALGIAPGIAFAGSARWLPDSLEQRLRRYVEQGGRVASFGADAFRRPVRVARGRAATTGPARPVDLFGERLGDLLRTSGAPLVVEEDELGVFGAADEFIGEFTLFERSEELPPRGELLTSAGRDPGEPAFVGYRLGRGIVIRSGTPQWGRELSPGRLGVEVPRATRRIWRVLSR